jgi:methylamine---corrinoid protein Co-methyltransferase
MRLDFDEIIDRSRQGQAATKEEWDFDHILSITRTLVQQYRLTWNKNEPISSDPDLADRVFQAGFDLLKRSGVYSIHTGRIISFDEKEIWQGMQAMPRRIEMGMGKDACILNTRQVMDPEAPRIWGGNPGAPTPQDLFLPEVMSWMQEPLVDIATCGSLTHVNGQEVLTGEASEVLATRQELRMLHEGLRQVGRAGMGLLAGQSSVSELGDLAVTRPDLLRPCDAHLVPMFNELIIDRHNLTRVANSLGYGMKNASLATVMVGGLAGDAPGAAVVQAASFMAANLVCQADIHLLHPIHIRHVATSTRSVLWVQSVVAQAFARNAPCIIVADIYPKSGIMTAEIFYEVAANAMAACISGAHLEGVGAADGALPNSSGLEVRFMAEVGQAVTRQGMDMQEANALTNLLLGRYEHIFQNPAGNPGVRFDAAYNVHSLKPLPEWETLYKQVKAEIRKFGLTYLG